MTENIIEQKPANRPGRLQINTIVGLALVIGLMMLGGCNKNSTNSNAANGSSTPPAAGTVVKNGMGMEFAYAPAGSFKMGTNDSGGGVTIGPNHQVTFAKGFYMGRYEVTQAQYQKVMDKNPSYFKNCDQCPVDGVSWNDTQEFIKKLNAQNDGYTYRLPSEAEWEYACRAGATDNKAGNIDAIAWYMKNSDKKTHPVGQKQPNAWGMYDMIGNVDEWIMDNYHNDYQGAPADGSVWSGGGSSNERVMRGGNWGMDDSSLRYADRTSREPDNVFNGVYLGFRVVAVPQP